MNLLASIRESLRSLRANRMRSGLTMLGIFIGIGAVIAMSSVGFGVQKSMTSEFEALGSDKLEIFSGSVTQNVRNQKQLSASDVEAIRKVPFVAAVSSTLQLGNATVSREDISSASPVTGVDAGYFETQGASFAAGRGFSEKESDSGAFVAVIGSDIRKRFFSDETEAAIGRSIRINNQVYTVVGVLNPKNSGMGGSLNRAVLVPMGTMENRLLPAQRGKRQTIGVKVRTNLISITAAEKEIKDVLRKQHEIEANGADDFSIMNIGTYLETFNQVFTVFVLFMSAVSGISLVVGGIGIMNIMLVTVTERTKEIGLRKAIGANSGNIRMQFLIESAVLSLVGGILGILFGIALAYLIGFIASSMGYPIDPVINPMMILSACGFSIMIGIFFGVYPAGRAAALQPVIALRTE